MFTGLVEEVGDLRRCEAGADSARLQVGARRVLEGTTPGDSISVNGVCLTVVDLEPDGFTADVMAETLNRTTLGGLEPGAALNLERAVRADSRLGGHIVQGHVDGEALVVGREPGDRWTVFRFETPAELGRYLAPKGSVTLDGVSLTVVDVHDSADHGGAAQTSFSVSLIPATLAETRLGGLEVGDRVNVEVDVIAKYVERLLAGGAG